MWQWGLDSVGSLTFLIAHFGKLRYEDMRAQKKKDRETDEQKQADRRNAISLTYLRIMSIG